MHETNDNLTALQRLLDASYARAGEHLRMIWGEDSRLDARQLRDELVGVQVLDLATVTPRGEPRVAPVDGFFFRGHFWFGSADNSLRFRNIRANPAVSAAITRGGETFLVLVHGRQQRPTHVGPRPTASPTTSARCTTSTGTRSTRTRPTRGSTRRPCWRSSARTNHDAPSISWQAPRQLSTA